MLLLILIGLTVEACLAGYCEIKTVADLTSQLETCTYVSLSYDSEVEQHPKLFDVLKKTDHISSFSLINTTLKKFTEEDTVLVDKDVSVTIMNNQRLEHLPRFNFLDATTTQLFITGNPKLNTTQIEEDCKALKCKSGTIIQPPFSCNFPPPQNAKCRNFYGRINVGEADSKQLDKVELLRGSIQLTRSNITEFPLLRNLKTLEQVDSFPVITIRQNPKLIGVEPLYNVDLKTNNESTAVVLEDNPLLCYNKRQANQPFVAKFMKGVKQCAKNVKNRGNAQDKGGINTFIDAGIALTIWMFLSP